MGIQKSTNHPSKGTLTHQKPPRVLPLLSMLGLIPLDPDGPAACSQLEAGLGGQQQSQTEPVAGTRLCFHSSGVTRQQMGEFTDSNSARSTGAQNPAILVLILVLENNILRTTARGVELSHCRGKTPASLNPCSSVGWSLGQPGLVEGAHGMRGDLRFFQPKPFWDLLERCCGSIPALHIHRWLLPREQPSSGATICLPKLQILWQTHKSQRLQQSCITP